MYSESLVSRVESDSDEVKHIVINGCPADLYLDTEPGKANVLVWMNNEIGAFFSISAPFRGDEIIKMAESVETRETAATTEQAT